MELTLDTKKRYTYADYLTWMDDQSRELLDGFIRLMSPAPTLTHAKISRVIFKEGFWLRKRKFRGRDLYFNRLFGRF